MTAAAIILIARLCLPLGVSPDVCTAVAADAGTDCPAAKHAMRHGDHGHRVTMMTCVPTALPAWAWGESETNEES